MSGIHPSAKIHPQALVEDGAVVGANTSVGPFSVLGAEVELAEDVVVKSHVVITGRTRIGPGSHVFPFTCLGEVPQDLKYSGEETRLEIGARNRIREHVTMNPGTEGGGGVTRVGDDCLFMAGTHVAHDCQIGDRVIMVNHSGAAGHCTIGDGAIIGGLSGVHQFVRVGAGAIIGGLTKVSSDVIPHALVQGPSGVLDGLNLVGLKRRGVPRDEIAALRDALQALAAGEGAFKDRAARLGEESDNALVQEIVRFVAAGSERGFLTP